MDNSWIWSAGDIEVIAGTLQRIVYFLPTVRITNQTLLEKHDQQIKELAQYKSQFLTIKSQPLGHRITTQWPFQCSCAYITAGIVVTGVVTTVVALTRGLVGGLAAVSACVVCFFVLPHVYKCVSQLWEFPPKDDFDPGRMNFEYNLITESANSLYEYADRQKEILKEKMDILSVYNISHSDAILLSVAMSHGLTLDEAGELVKRMKKNDDRQDAYHVKQLLERISKFRDEGIIGKLKRISADLLASLGGDNTQAKRLECHYGATAKGDGDGNPFVHAATRAEAVINKRMEELRYEMDLWQKIEEAVERERA